MSHDLKEGVQIRCIVCQPDPTRGTAVFRVSSMERNTPRRITVSEQPGEMAMVPWARVEYDNGRVVLVNLAHVESVELETQEQQS